MNASANINGNNASTDPTGHQAMGRDVLAIAPMADNLPVYLPDSIGDVVERGGLAPWQRKKVIRYIEENLTTTVRIEQLAELVRLSVSHFSRAFRLTFGKPPYGYILERRMMFAKTLMAETNVSLSQIALDCGMTDQAHFCKVFRKTFGTSPNRWRLPNRATHTPSVRSLH
jgi:AraC family transcriptional regulator